MLLSLEVLLEDATAMKDETGIRIHCLQDRDHIQQNLARGCARGLQLIALHQLHLSLRLDEMAVEMADA